MTETNTTDSVRIERIVAAPPRVVWQLWTQAADFAAWYGPAGSSISVTTMDLRVGGVRLLCMDVVTPQGPRQMWFTGTYLEIVENQRLVYTDSMSDEHGNVITAEQLGMPAGHPTTTEVHVELEAHPAGTRMTLTHFGIPAGSPGAVGWTMALDKLDAYVDASTAQ